MLVWCLVYVAHAFPSLVSDAFGVGMQFGVARQLLEVALWILVPPTGFVGVPSDERVLTFQELCRRQLAPQQGTCHGSLTWCMG